MARDERFAFKKLEVYRTALDYYGWVLGVFQRVKKADLPLADQVRRQAQSIVHNTGEGAGHWRSGNKRKYYGIARASTFEAAAALTRLCQRYDTG